MKLKIFFSTLVIAATICWGMVASANAGSSKGSDNNKDVASSSPAENHAVQDDSMRLEGEKRYHENCGRCHAAPPKFAPRMMTTIVRHMRVRATITDQDMHLILHYMTH